MPKILPFRTAGLVALLVLAAQGCTVMYPTRLSPPVQARQDASGMDVSVGQVALSVQLRGGDFYPGSRIAVALLLHNQGTAPIRVDLQEFKLRMQDAFGHAQTHAPLATGLGTPPKNLYDDEFAPLVGVPPGETVRAWVAFGEFSERQAREIPERIVLVLPGPSKTTREITLSDPGRPPVWHADAVGYSAALGLTGKFGPDGDASGSLDLTQRYWIDPMWFAWSWGIGPQWTDGWSTNDECCVLSARALVGLPIERGRMGAISPFIGGEFAPLLQDSGPWKPRAAASLGLSLALNPLQSQHGPFPVSYERSVLGAGNFDIAFMWWFGDGLPPEGAPGIRISTDYSIGH